ncbi:MAG TPA: peptidoglycan-associated lipoprotein Pal, partial [Acidobacteriota bacterium]|nr:peptidoglycan-associated lipoprotein Pal [Acidobacteriota bacterium]
PTVPPVQPAPPAPTPTVTLRAAPASIDRGQAASLEWEAKNTTSVRIEPEVGNVQNQGKRSVTPSSSVTYTATAMGPGGSASDSTRVTVRIPAVAAVPADSRSAPGVGVDELFKQNVQTIYFDYDQADLRPDQISRLQADAAWLKSHRGLKFTIEGNCDERGSEEYNLGLGDRRANAVKEFLIKEGVEPSSINTISYGEERPVCRETTEDCYQRNRRASFVPSGTR